MGTRWRDPAPKTVRRGSAGVELWLWGGRDATSVTHIGVKGANWRFMKIGHRAPGTKWALLEDACWEAPAGGAAAEETGMTAGGGSDLST